MAKSKSQKTPRIYQRTLSVSSVSMAATDIETSPLVVNQLSPGMPSLDSVITHTKFESPSGVKYLILRTNEIDTYKKIPVGLSVNEFVALAVVPVSDKFEGKARKAAKLSIATAEIEQFDDLKDFLQNPVSEKVSNKEIAGIST